MFSTSVVYLCVCACVMCVNVCTCFCMWVKVHMFYTTYVEVIGPPVGLYLPSCLRHDLVISLLRVPGELAEGLLGILQSSYPISGQESCYYRRRTITNFTKVLGSKLKSSCLHSKQFTHKTTPPSNNFYATNRCR